jgi:hypothetical protein
MPSSVASETPYTKEPFVTSVLRGSTVLGYRTINIWSLVENKFRYLNFLSNTEVKIRKLSFYTTGRQSRIEDRCTAVKYVFIHLSYIAP